MRLSSFLYKAARASRDAKALTGGSVTRRAKNKAAGRVLGPVWRQLWK